MLKETLVKYAKDPENDVLNYEMGLHHYQEKHWAQALNFFLRCSELTRDNELAYQSLLLCSNCLFYQGDRLHSAVNFILHAISLIPERAEAWFLYLRVLETRTEWQECYAFSTISYKICNFYAKNFAYSGYPGKYGIDFIQAKAAYRIGRRTECRKILQKIVDDHWSYMSDDYKYWVGEEIKRLGDGYFLNAGDTRYDFVIRYEKNKLNRYKFPFPGIELIQGNFSQSYQDMFILSTLKGKRNGSYLEIGSQDPHHNSNTALLEEFGWSGVSIEIVKESVDTFNEKRKNPCFCYDATQVNYREFVPQNFSRKEIDYLQLDCEPAKTTFEVLLGIPFEEYKFAVITYEHDHSMDFSREYREKSRNYLKSLGYVLVVNDISPNDWFTYEDWWVHPDLVDEETINKMKSVKEGVNMVEEYFLK
jgi:hypothetical protein